MPIPEHVGVYGGGRMGAGIAHVVLLTGARVVVIETDETAAESARKRVRTSLSRAADRNLLGEPIDSVLERLSGATEASALATTDLVIEAVPESFALKATVLRTIQAAAPAAHLATNTSSLSVSQLAEELERPENLIGLHFFNPVPASELVEIVVGPRTRDELVRHAQDWTRDLGKTAITVTDAPGFASSRLGVAIALEAMRMVEEGVASATDIDLAMTLGYRHPTGPLKTTDIVGLDVRLAIAEHLERELGPRFAPPELLRQMVRDGEVGRKAGQGFYSWPTGTASTGGAPHGTS